MPVPLPVRAGSSALSSAVEPSPGCAGPPRFLAERGSAVPARTVWRLPGAAVLLLGERLGAVLAAEGFLRYRATEKCGRRMRSRCGLGTKGWANSC